jgi:hypothetical protein
VKYIITEKELLSGVYSIKSLTSIRESIAKAIKI